MVLAYGTGCGKTPTSITAVTRFLTEKRNVRPSECSILVVCPAIVRRHWVAEFERWASLGAMPIEMGRHRKTGSKPALALRDAAYDAQVQIVSYDLAHEVEQSDWDAIIFDEVHHLSDCTSRQSRTAQRLMRSNPGVVAMGLSATLIPTELWQLWHPMWLLFGNTWGVPPKAGKICWDFVARYCHIEANEYGRFPGKPRESRQAELRKRLDGVVHRLNREDIAADLPPVDCRVLSVPGATLARGLELVEKRAKVRPEVRYAVEWYRSLEPDITHAVILCYHRDVARAVAQALTQHVSGLIWLGVIDGTISTADRVRELAVAEASPRAILIATSESLREGVRLMWAQKVLLAEWRQSPVQVIQTLGRFYSVGDRRRPQIEVLSDESLYGAAQKLVSRMTSLNHLLKAGNAEAVVQQVFAPSELTEERMAELTQTMIAQFNPRDAQWAEESEEADEW